MKIASNALFRLALAAAVAASIAWIAGCGSSSLGTSVTLRASQTTVATGTSITLTGTVFVTAHQLVSEDPNGTMTFYDGSTVLGTAPLNVNLSSATLSVAFTTPGTHALTATFKNSDSYYGASTSGVLDVVAGTAASEPLASGGAASIYVLQAPNSGNSSILQFSTTSNGTVAPTSTITLPSGFTASSLAVDSSGQMYVGAYQSSSSTVGEIFVYAAGATGTATPIRTINGSTSSFQLPAALSIDATGKLYVCSENSLNTGTVSVFAANVSGTATPIQQITGSGNYLIGPALSAAVDGVGNLYVLGSVSTGNGTPTELLVFPSGTTGNATPSRIITPAANEEFLNGLAVDTNGDAYVTQEAIASNSPAAIVEFAPGANGTATPIKTIAGTATDLGFVDGLALDTAGNLYTVQTGPTVLAFGPTANAEAIPALNLNSSAWTTTAASIAFH